MADVTTTVDTYLSAYNETDAAARLALLEEAFTVDGRLIDPPIGGEGRPGISDMRGDEHHGYLRYGWELLDPAGNVALAGMDVGELDSSSQLVRVTGFFGPLPEIV